MTDESHGKIARPVESDTAPAGQDDGFRKGSTYPTGCKFVCERRLARTVNAINCEPHDPVRREVSRHAGNRGEQVLSLRRQFDCRMVAAASATWVSRIARRLVESARTAATISGGEV
jgi:hypothetical protein